MICVYPGSFDPPTLGHENLLKRAAALFDEVIFALLINPAKSGLIPRQERLHMMEKLASPISNVRVMAFSGLLGDFAVMNGASVILRGIRSTEELGRELPAAEANRNLFHVETLFLPAESSLGYISSSAVREVASFGGEWKSWVPPCIREDAAVYLNKKA